MSVVPSSVRRASAGVSPAEGIDTWVPTVLFASK